MANATTKYLTQEIQLNKEMHKILKASHPKPKEVKNLRKDLVMNASHERFNAVKTIKDDYKAAATTMTDNVVKNNISLNNLTRNDGLFKNSSTTNYIANETKPNWINEIKAKNNEDAAFDELRKDAENLKNKGTKTDFNPEKNAPKVSKSSWSSGSAKTDALTKKMDSALRNALPIAVGGGLVFSMFNRSGQMSNSELYGQQNPYQY